MVAGQRITGLLTSGVAGRVVFGSESRHLHLEIILHDAARFPSSGPPAVRTSLSFLPSVHD